MLSKKAQYILIVLSFLGHLIGSGIHYYKKHSHSNNYIPYITLVSEVNDTLTVKLTGCEKYSIEENGNIRTVDTKVQRYDYEKSFQEKLVLTKDVPIKIEGNVETMEVWDSKKTSFSNGTLIDVCHADNLKNLRLSSKSIDSAYIVSLQALETFDCSSCSIKNLDVRFLMSLRDLNCSNNGLENIQFKDNNKLVYLSLQNNELDSLDVSKLPLLRYLECQNNKLKHLNVANGINAWFYHPMFLHSAPPYWYDRIAVLSLFLPDDKTAFDASNNPNLKQIQVDYQFNPRPVLWHKDSLTHWKPVGRDNLQNEEDLFYTSHRDTCFPNFSKENARVMRFFATKNKDSIASTISYPILINHPLKDITCKEEYVALFDKLYTSEILDTLSFLEPESMWYNEILCSSYRSGLTKYYYENNYQKSVDDYQSQLYKGLSKKLKPTHRMVLKNVKINFDRLPNYNYRITVWNKEDSYSEKPLYVINDVEELVEGSQYTFRQYYQLSASCDTIYHVLLSGMSSNENFSFITVRKRTTPNFTFKIPLSEDHSCYSSRMSDVMYLCDSMANKHYKEIIFTDIVANPEIDDTDY